MKFPLPGLSYPPAGDGYWTPVTSTLDWCEENYYATYYVAEVVNALTNMLFLYLGVRGIYNCLSQGHDRIFLVSFAGYLLVGSGSFLFHSTLKYPMQLVDELSMIYTTCIMFYATFAHRKGRQFRITMAISLVSLAAFISLYYHYLQDPLFHQNMYALLTAIVVFRALYIMEVNIRPQWKDKQRAVDAKELDEQNGYHTPLAPNEKVERRRQDERDAVILRTMWTMIAYGLSTFLGGFAIWNLDNIYCGTLRRWRRDIGLPWGIVLEGHGWWHLLTGIGAYFYIVWGIWLRHCLNQRQDEYELVWPRTFTSFPEIVRTKKAANGTSNGAVKKKI